MRYRGCEIIESNTRLQDGQYLYNIKGRFSKPAPIRPFLPTIESAKEWIDQRLALDSDGSSSEL